MFKKLLFTLIMIPGMNQFLQAQDPLLYGIFPVNNGKIMYEKNVSIDSVSKDELFKRGRDWALRTYKAQKDTNQIEDKEQGLLTYKGFVTVLFTEPARRVAAEWNCWHTIKILCSDNKTKIIITDLEQRAPSGYGTITSVKIEGIKSKTDSLPKSVFFGKNNKARYWKTELVSLREIDSKIKALIASLEKSLKSDKPD